MTPETKQRQGRLGSGVRVRCFVLKALLLAGVLSGLAVLGQPVRAQTIGTQLSPQPCSLESSLHAVNANVSTSVTFVNQMSSAVDIYWLDYNGQRQLYATLAAGTTVLQQTYVTHPWVAAGPSGTCIAIFLPLGAPAFAVITGPAAGASGVASTTVASIGTQLSPLPCSLESSLHAVNANVSTSVTFVNQTSSAVDIYWLDYSGQRQLYATLAAGTTLLQQTYVTHPWVAAGPSSTCIAIFLPLATPTLAVITNGTG